MVREVVHLWAHRKITDIGKRDILDAIDRVADRGHKTSALRLYAHLHRMFQWCLGRSIVTVNPVTALPKPGDETRRDRVLNDAELIAVWNAAEKIGYPYGQATQLLILTGARRQEIAALKWSELEDGAIVGRQNKERRAALDSAIELRALDLGFHPEDGRFCFQPHRQVPDSKLESG